MKTILYTGYDKAYEPLAELTVPLMEAYARTHGWRFKAFTQAPGGFSIYWTGVVQGLNLLESGFDRVVYLDVDQMVTNLGFPFEANMAGATGANRGFHVPRDWGNDATTAAQCSACCLVLHHDCRHILEAIIELEPDYRDKPFPEQAPMRDELQRRTIDINEPVFFHARKPWNCVPEEVCPGNVPAPWAPLDWCAHLTMLPLKERIDLFHKIKAKLC